MPAIGRYTGREYSEPDILVPARYLEMLDEPLTKKETKELVVPVRRRDAPCFRRLAVNPYGVKVGRGERDPRHNECIDYLLARLNDERGEFVISTPTFVDGERIADGQIFLRSRKAGVYRWWSDAKGTRIPVGNGRYIQPDLCGRLADGEHFHAHAKAPNVIIEVIQTHYPERETMLELLRLSEKNHLVVLVFMGQRSYGSRYSRIDVFEEQFRMVLRPVIVLLGGNSVKNGEPYEPAPNLDGTGFDEWYATYEQKVLLRAMNDR